MVQKIRVGAEGEISDGGYKVLALNEPIAVFNLGGDYFAINDYCTHEKCSLTQEGYVIGDEVECGWHCAKFSIRTDEVTAPPATKNLKTYEVFVENSEIFVLVPGE